ncbi:MAG: hypothetical protein PHS98_02525 [Bacilli bacterium]|nr:hypothetical protein [Bacilli bacterium]
MDKETEKAHENNDIVIRLQNLKETVLEIIDSKYRYALLILLARINDCIDKITVDKLIILQVVASDLNNLYEKYGVIEEALDYIYSETNVLLELYEK